MDNREFNDLTTDEKSRAVGDSIALMRTLTEIWGSDRGMELWEKISEAIGDDIKGEIFFGMIAGRYHPRALFIKTAATYNLVSMIKAIRSATGMGLKESKDLCDLVKNEGPQKLECPDSDSAKLLAKELRNLGCEVS